MGVLRNFVIFSMVMTFMVNIIENIERSSQIDPLIPSKENALIVLPIAQPPATCPMRPLPICRLVPSTRIVCDYYR